MKHGLLHLIAFIGITGQAAFSASPVESYGQLRVDGKYIVSENGAPVQLTGMCLFWSQWSGELWNADVVNWLVDDWHCTVLRFSMGVPAGGYLENPVREKNRVITVVDQCIKRGVYAIIDWHVEAATPYEEQAIPFFREMAQKYGNTPNVMYELWNEPHNNSWGEVKGYADRVTAEIRKIDPDNIVCVATPAWDRQINAPLKGRVNDNNSVYVCHFYAATDGAGLRAAIDGVAGAGLPLFVTEWGTSEGTGDGRIDLASTQAFWDILDKHSIGHTNWSIVHKGESSAAITTNAPSNPTTANPWTAAHLTASGTAVRNKLRSYPTPATGTVYGSMRPAARSITTAPSTVLLLNGRAGWRIGPARPEMTTRCGTGIMVLKSSDTAVLHRQADK